MVESLARIAQRNMRTMFVMNPHRGIVVGRDAGGDHIHLSWIMGRSDNSKNRLYEVVNRGGEDNEDLGPIVRTRAADPSSIELPELVIYTAMDVAVYDDGDHDHVVHVVSNGNQTDTITGEMTNEDSIRPGAFCDAVDSRYCEPDPPTFTPRISAFSTRLSPSHAWYSILRADPHEKDRWIAAETEAEANGKTRKGMGAGAFNDYIGERTGLSWQEFPTSRDMYDRMIPKGFGHCLVTYAPGNPDTLPTYMYEPFAVPLEGDLETIMRTFWGAISPDYKVALVGKRIDMATGEVTIPDPINTREPVGS